MPSSALSSAIQWLPPIFQRMVRPPARTGLLSLPPEILDLIASHLSKPSVILLSLTCRSLLSMYCNGAKHLNKDEKIELLQQLEKMVPRRYVCHLCVRLHVWNPAQFANGRDHRGDIIADLMNSLYRRTCKTEFVFCRFYAYTYRIPYHCARLVMNAHFYGPEHGISLKKLDERKSQVFNHGLTIDYVWQARIIDDQLMLSSRVTIVQAQADRKTLKRCIDRHVREICRHTMALPPPVSLLDLAMTSTPPDDFGGYKACLRSCTRCMTDYTLDMKRHSEPKGWVIKMVTYLRLGPVRSPLDWDWLTMTNASGRQEGRATHPLGGPPGIVRHAWSKGDRTVLKPEGEWVGERAIIPAF